MRIAILLAVMLGAQGEMAHAQTLTAEAAIKRFLALNAEGGLQTAEGRAARADEASAWDVDTIGPLPLAFDRLLPVGENEAVVRVVAPTLQDGEVDLYFFERRGHDGWRVAAMRTLALTGMIYVLRDQLRAIEAPSREDAATLLNLDLVLSSDSNLREWFEAHRDELDALAQAALARADRVDQQAKALGLSAVNTDDDAVNAAIGGMIDNTVGFVRAGRQGPPVISASDHIWVEDLGGGWYLYRTT